MTPEEKQEAKDQVADLIATFEDEHNSDTIREVIQETMEILNAAMPEESERCEKCQSVIWHFCPVCEILYTEIAKRVIEEYIDTRPEGYIYPNSIKCLMFWLDQGGE